ncbi:MAG: hypothetical protein O9337_00660 [Acidovorax sp.]|uniref:hypothetical protein n=1 Tax=Acidovorax sp. TaxID=1872122 RepID=UPI0022CB59E2|nr:hypothetical protein [Acidovorax sp.]MCZ8217899.1 hypothetical protein [Acidovorax sp.]
MLQPPPADTLPVVVLLGAPHTGAEALAGALRQHIALGAAHIVAAPEMSPTLPVAQHDPLARARTATLVLLMGLDTPCPPEDRAIQEAVDTQLRTALQQAGVPHRVIYGQGEKRTEHALNAIKSIATKEHPTGGNEVFDAESSTHTQRLRAWNCEKCSDPVCEHRLFTSLVGSRQTRPD